jgi:hypothetical protein
MMEEVEQLHSCCDNIKANVSVSAVVTFDNYLEVFICHVCLFSLEMI